MLLRARRVRCEGHPRRAGRRGRAAARRGETRVGLLFVVGEERGSDGAMAANTHRVAVAVSDQRRADRQSPRRRDARRLSRAAASPTGRAAHSGYPELGESAIEKLVDALVALRRHAVAGGCGAGHDALHVGLISGGIAPNVIPPRPKPRSCFAPSAITTTLRHDRCARRGRRSRRDRGSARGAAGAAAHRAGLRDGGVRLHDRHPVPRRWGTPLLLGPGSIHVAHTDREHVRHRRAARRRSTSTSGWRVELLAA